MEGLRNIKCISCKYAIEDKSASEGAWVAYECSNTNSEFHKALLNVGIHGKMHKRISWRGCEQGERREPDETLSKAGIQGGK